MFRKKDFVESRSVCVETEWWRVPMIDTPELNLARRYMLERLDHDFLSQKMITIFKAKGRTVAKNRDGNSISLATHLYKHSTSKEELEALHDMVVRAVISGEITLEGYSADLSLRAIIEDYNNAKNSTGGKTEPDPCVDSGTERPVA